MDSINYYRKDCRLCNSERTDTVLKLLPTPIADNYVSENELGISQESYPLELNLCLDCGHVQLPYVVDPELLFGSYTYKTSISMGLVEHFKRYASEMVELFKPPQGSLVIDIGSNDGTLLGFFKGYGMSVLGVDPAREIALEATDNGIPTLPEYLTPQLAEEIKKEYGAASIITANNVFAHADDLIGMSHAISKLLDDDGIFVFEVSYLMDIIENKLFDTVYHEHLCYHSVHPLVKFFKNNGMELIDVQQIGNKGGSIRGVAQLSGGPKPVKDSVFEYVDSEKKYGLDTQIPFQKLQSSLEVMKDEVCELLNSFRSQGKVITGYGASATVTTLLHYFELGGFLDFVVDDNTIKHGTYTPGHHIPVFPSEALYQKNADVSVIMAWAYSDPIIRRHDKFLSKGGKFVIPVPEVQVV